MKGLSNRNLRYLALSAPFCQAEFIYRRGRSDLCTFIDGTPINENLQFRSQFSHLQTAGHLSKGILISQLPGKSSPALYQLLTTYFKHIPTFTDPSPLVLSFYLKLLKHEGLLELSSLCSACSLHPATTLHEGESYCPQHRPPSFIPFTAQEWTSLQHLAHAHTFQQLREINLSIEFTQTLTAYFNSRFK
jgi:DNA repair protein RecO (recombination protein O)